jgi:hypothetical protein
MSEPSGHSSKTPLVIGLIAAAVIIGLVLAFWLPRRGAQPVAAEPQLPEIGAVAQRQATPPPAPVVERPAQPEPAPVAPIEETPTTAPTAPEVPAAVVEAMKNVAELPELFEATPTVPVEPEVEESAPTVAAASLDLSRVEPAVLAWANAWSGQRVDDYLEFYANEFVPPDRLSRDEWETQRFTRLRKPAWIKIELGDFRQRSIGRDRVSVTFSQAYSSDTFSDTVDKTLELVWEEGAWKIAKEDSS